MQNPIYTEVTSCRDCYKCVRSCPVKAIQIKEGHAMIIKDLCIYCGHCVHVCPNSAKKVREDKDRVKLAISSGRKVICSLAPSYASEFEGFEKELLTALKKLGFAAVSETAIGATLVSQALDIYSEKHGGSAPFIGTACPSVVELVKKYYPESVERLAPVPSPLQTHAAYLRHIYNEDFAIAFIGPCIAKKVEADTTLGYPDFAITFKELRSWLEEEGIDLASIEAEDVDFIPAKAGTATIYPVEGGQIATSEIWSGKAFATDALAFSGIDQVMSVLSGDTFPMAFLELLTCDGGCINGPSVNDHVSMAERKTAASAYTTKRLDEADLFKGDKEFAELLLEKGYGLLHHTGPKPLVSSRGGGCGYNTCRDMAIAYLDGMAEVEMCVTKMRKEAESKVDVLLRNIPTGVVIVDSDLQIADCNVHFLEFFGDMEESFLDQSILQMVKGLPLERFVPFSDKFRDQFYLTHPGQYRVHFKDKYLKVTFFLVESKRLLGAMFEDITTPTIRRETVVKKAEDVIQKSLETVQQIASLLGENAAETEIMLNSLIDAFSVHGTGDGESDFRQDNGDLS